MSSAVPLIIHPEDRSTKFLECLYSIYSNWFKLNQYSPNHQVREELKSRDRDIMMLGHGAEYCLYAPQGINQFGREIISSEHVQFLRGKDGIIGLWCNANCFAYRYSLTGLFSGMVISEVSEAIGCGFYDITEELIIDSRQRWAEDLRDSIIESSGNLSLVPKIMLDKPQKNEIDRFNYSSLYYIVSGEDIDES